MRCFIVFSRRNKSVSEYPVISREQKCIDELASVLFLEEFFRKLNIPWKKRSLFLRGFTHFGGEKEELIEALENNDAGFLIPDLSPSDWPLRQAEQLYSEGVRVALPAKPDWPQNLNEIADPPSWLWYKGFRPSLFDGQESCAIVGSRRPEAYTRQVCEDICRILCGQGHPIISGLALGVDSLAHSWALRFGGCSAAVLPVGITGCYPRENEGLMLRLSEQGFVCSEFPPSYPLLKANFHSRNRLISGLCKTVIILQGAERSGTLITAGCAAEQNRRIFVVPGTIYMKSYFGSHQLIRDGAAILEQLNQLRELPLPRKPDLAALMKKTRLPAAEKTAASAPFPLPERVCTLRDFLRLLAYRELGPAGIREISGLSEETIMSRLLEAESRQLVERRRGKLFLTDKGLSCIT